VKKNLRRIAQDTIERYEMLGRGDSVLVALSGGPDSVCLLDVLEHLRPKYSLTISVAHFNHRLRGEASNQDAAFAREVAARKGLVFISSSADVRAAAEQEKLSIEAAGRKLRYAFLLRSSQALGAIKIAVGHTADDQAETVLMRLLRGSGPEGFAGIPPVRFLTRPLGEPSDKPSGASSTPKIIRPLINVWRSEIMAHVREHKLRYCEDETNLSPEYLRNRVRHDLIPELEAHYNPQIKRRLVNAAASLALESDFMEAEASLLSSEILLESNCGWVVFDAGTLAELHPALRKRIISNLVRLARADSPMLESSHYQDADALLCAGAGKLDLPGKLRLEISERTGLISETLRPRANFPPTLNIALGGSTMIPHFDIVVKTKLMTNVSAPQRLVKLCNANRQYFDMDLVKVPLEIRARRAGDSFSPLGANGSKKLKDYFIDKKVPRFLRDHVPLLFSNGKIMWVMGHAMDREFRLKPNSKAALRVDYEKRTTGNTPH
jgi:tRNA(Ile)-lysidine synthase